MVSGARRRARAAYPEPGTPAGHRRAPANQPLTRNGTARPGRVCHAGRCLGL